MYYVCTALSTLCRSQLLLTMTVRENVLLSTSEVASEKNSSLMCLSQKGNISAHIRQGRLQALLDSWTQCSQKSVFLQLAALPFFLLALFIGSPQDGH